MMISLFILSSFFNLISSQYNLPYNHLEFYFKNNANDYFQFCNSTNQQVYKFNCSKSIDELKCWGYENDKKCREWINKYPIKPYCYSKLPGHENLDENKKIFYYQSDFGWIEKRKDELKFYCQPLNDSLKSNSTESSDLSLNKISSSKLSNELIENSSKNQSTKLSYLKCTDYLRFCEGENIFIDFRKLSKLPQPMKYRTDLIEDGDIGAIYNCKLDQNLLNKQNAHKSPLQSWYEELEHFTVLNDNKSIDKKCDLTINKTIYIMKLDATVNMYHHFCDFVNLYLTLHLANDFSLDKQILIWDTYSYRSYFNITFNAFTNHNLLNLNKFKNKKVCFKHVLFPLLPRMIYGLYYNMPLINGCKRSGLIHAFKTHILNNLNIVKDQKELLKDELNSDKRYYLDNQFIKLNITFLSRSTSYRKVINEMELINSIRNQSDNFNVIKVDFNHKIPFQNQLEIISRTDIFISIHGAGLTHLLFLPDWGAVFEIFNCDDSCYKDLARLRGIKHITWKKRSKLKFIRNQDSNKPDHLKFTDYYFDRDEFMKRFNVAVQYVRKKKLKYLNKIRLNRNDDQNLHKIEPKTEL